MRNCVPLSALILATALAAGCNNTLEQVSFPSSVSWNHINTYIASPYPDLEALTVGENITARTFTNGYAAYCGSAAGAQTFNECNGPTYNCEQACTANGYTYYGTRYWYVIEVTLNRPAFQAGGVQLTSNTAGGTVNSISFAINSSNQIKMVAGLSEGTIPVSGDPPSGGQAYLADNYASIGFEPHDPAFASAVYGADPNVPELRCIASGGGDAIVFNTQTATAGSYNCGIPISLTLTPPYATVGDCISDSILKNCKNQGLTGKARAACNAAQIGNCHASFHVPSAHAQ